MASPRTKALMVGATLLGGLLAGMSANKVLVELPAWQAVGVVQWALFTRASDQGVGLILFPVIGGGALILSVAAAVSFRSDRFARRSGAWAVYLAPFLAIIALAVTILLLAPPRLSVLQAGDDATVLQPIAASVARWWDVKAFLHVLAFLANLWALASVLVAVGKTAPATRNLLVVAILIGGLLAGFNLDRSLVHNPAWRELGAQAWAAYSLHADLSYRAAALYPFLGIGEALVSVAAAISFWRSGGRSRPAALPVHGGALFAVSGLLMTLLAAPNMLSIPRLANDPAGLANALAGFIFWGDIRGALQILAFFVNLWSLIAVTSGARREGQGRP